MMITVCAPLVWLVNTSYPSWLMLWERLGVEEKKPSLGQYKRQSVGGQDGPKPKKAKHEGPAEDYSKKAVKAIAKDEESAKVKALKASAKGTKSIASFFTKKT